MSPHAWLIHNGRYRLDLPSLAALAEYGRAAPSLSPSGTDYRASEKEEAKMQWDGGQGLDGARRIAQEGDPEGAAQARALAARITQNLSPVTSSRWTMAHRLDVAGDEVDTGRFLAGEPENMIEYFQEAADGTGARFVWIVANIGDTFNVPASSLAARGAFIGALADRLEAAGYRCKITAESHCTISGAGVFSASISWTAKDYGAALDAGTVAASFHPATLRRLCFRAREALPKLAKLSESYGTSIDVSDATEPGAQVIHMTRARWQTLDPTSPADLLQVAAECTQTQEAAAC